MRQACRQAKAWHNHTDGLGRIGVNVSLRQFEEPGFVNMVSSVLDETGLQPQGLELEITERMLMRDEKGALKTLQQLDELGVWLAIDDFGTGYSSLSYLKRLPIHRLKIDKSFVSELPHNRDDEAICQAVIGLGQSMSLEVIAEGVETAEQGQALQRLGCQEAQGYFYWRPLSVEAFQALL